MKSGQVPMRTFVWKPMKVGKQMYQTCLELEWRFALRKSDEAVEPRGLRLTREFFDHPLVRYVLDWLWVCCWRQLEKSSSVPEFCLVIK
ncbi:hypothetical protein V6N13_092064 [Hibiscus sabdariffa]